VIKWKNFHKTKFAGLSLRDRGNCERLLCWTRRQNWVKSPRFFLRKSWFCVQQSWWC